MSDRLVYDGDVFDELVVHGADIHIERMDYDKIFVCVSRGRTELFRGWLSVQKRSLVLWQDTNEDQLRSQPKERIA